MMHSRWGQVGYGRCYCATLAALVALVSMVAAPAAADTLSNIRQTGTLLIGYREASIPFSYLDANGRPIGYSIDLCLRIADAIRQQLKMPKMDVKYVAVTPSSRIPAVVNGTVDLECGSTTNTAARRKDVAFTIPHYIAGSRILARTESGIRSIDDLRDRTIVTTRGTTTLNILKEKDAERDLHFKLIEGKDHRESFALVENGTADAFVMDDVLLYSLRATSQNPKNTAIVGEFLSVEPYAIMLRRDDPDFKKLVDATMIRIITDFEINRIYAKWFESPIPPSGVSLELPMNHLLRDSFKFPSDAVGD